MSYGADGPDSFRWAIAHCRDMMIARSALSPSSPRLRRAAICGIGLDRSARPRPPQLAASFIGSLAADLRRP
jgi:hypothetical protein